jgi:hypothetical protein
MSVHTHATVGSEKNPPTSSTSSSARATTWERVDFDRYVVTVDGPVGYIEVVPPLFVCHAGHPYAKAEEIAQVHDFDRAVRIVAARAGASQSYMLAR